VEDTKTLPSDESSKEFKEALAAAVAEGSENMTPKKKTTGRKKAAEKTEVETKTELTPFQKYWKNLGSKNEPRVFPDHYRFHLTKKERKGKTYEQIQELRKELFSLSKM